MLRIYPEDSPPRDPALTVVVLAVVVQLSKRPRGQPGRELEQKPSWCDPEAEVATTGTAGIACSEGRAMAFIARASENDSNFRLRDGSRGRSSVEENPE